MMETAADHKVMPLIYWSIKSVCPKSLPSDIAAQLNADFKNNTVHNLTLTSELFNILDLFRSNFIPAIPFKGPILASSIYGNVALRQFLDLDILVHPEDFIKAKDLLISDGYVPRVNLSDEQYEALIRHDKRVPDFSFFKTDSGVHLEIHWSVSPKIYGSGLETHSLFERAESLIISGHEITCFSPEDMLLLLCHHGTKHLWTRISWICDVAMLVRDRAINWTHVIELAQDASINRSLCLGILLSYDLLKAPIPNDVLHKAQQDMVAGLLSQQVKAKMFQKDNTSFLQVSIFHFRTLERPSDRLRFFLNFIKIFVLKFYQKNFVPNFSG